MLHTQLLPLCLLSVSLFARSFVRSLVRSLLPEAPASTVSVWLIRAHACLPRCVSFLLCTSTHIHQLEQKSHISTEQQQSVKSSRPPNQGQPTVKERDHRTKPGRAASANQKLEKRNENSLVVLLISLLLLSLLCSGRKLDHQQIRTVPSLSDPLCRLASTVH